MITVWLFSAIMACPTCTVQPFPQYFPNGVFRTETGCNLAKHKLDNIETDKDFKDRNIYNCEEVEVRTR